MKRLRLQYYIGNDLLVPGGNPYSWPSQLPTSFADPMGMSSQIGGEKTYEDYLEEAQELEDYALNHEFDDIRSILREVGGGLGMLSRNLGKAKDICGQCDDINACSACCADNFVRGCLQRMGLGVGLGGLSGLLGGKFGTTALAKLGSMGLAQVLSLLVAAGMATGGATGLVLESNELTKCLDDCTRK